MNTLRKLDKYGKSRIFVVVNCDGCGLQFEKRKSLLKTKNYCCRNCQHKKMITQIKFVCAFCSLEFYRRPSRKKNSRSGLFFCSRKCKDTAQSIEHGFAEIHPSHYKNGENNYRDKALRHYPNECNRCGYKKNVKILQVHHKDENRQNNALENLEVLCPNCHAEIHWG
jgi:phage terminase large subunit GpA-like protein